MAYADTNFELPCAALNSNSDSEALYQAGLIYATGKGVAEDLVTAHKWFNLAALRGHEAAKICRMEMADQMTDADLKAALKQAREWLRTMN